MIFVKCLLFVFGLLSIVEAVEHSSGPLIVNGAPPKKPPATVEPDGSGDSGQFEEQGSQNQHFPAWSHGQQQGPAMYGGMYGAPQQGSQNQHFPAWSHGQQQGPAMYGTGMYGAPPQQGSQNQHFPAWSHGQQQGPAMYGTGMYGAHSTGVQINIFRHGVMDSNG
ncbi:hypothetical protein APHAL10511_000378 [Amanita phalloides]|nr:hypothetical protein APHAL10511_000378 [Amanita phalloides]